MRKKWFVTICILITITVVGKGYIEFKFNKPYQVIAALIQEAQLDKNDSDLLLNHHDWEAFKKLIQNVPQENTRVGPIYSFWYQLNHFHRNSHSVYVYIYDTNGNEVESVSLLMKKVEGKWKVVGIQEQ